MIEGRLWWEQTSTYWDLPFYAEFGLTGLPDRDDWLAAREQLWYMREFGDFELSPSQEIWRKTKEKRTTK